LRGTPFRRLLRPNRAAHCVYGRARTQRFQRTCGPVEYCNGLGELSTEEIDGAEHAIALSSAQRAPGVFICLLSLESIPQCLIEPSAKQRNFGKPERTIGCAQLVFDGECNANGLAEAGFRFVEQASRGGKAGQPDGCVNFSELVMDVTVDLACGHQCLLRLVILAWSSDHVSVPTCSVGFSESVGKVSIDRASPLIIVGCLTIASAESLDVAERERCICLPCLLFQLLEQAQREKIMLPCTV